jgi:CelD/BcsL family acetyltransferase involved in cellulose biosynthesis
VLVDCASTTTQFDTSPHDAMPAQAPHALPPQSAITIEIASGERLLALESQWQDLVARADAANIFMHPALVHLGNEAYLERRCRVLLAWQETTVPRLAGVWAFAVGHPPRSILPISVLIAPAVPNAYLSAPVVDRDCLDEVLAAMLDHLAAAVSLPSVVALDAMGADTATMQALIRVLEQRGSPMRIFTRSMRPMLDSNLDGKAYLEQALSSSSRKKLRQHRRRLAEKGSLRSAVLTEPQSVRDAFEDFLTLEAAGWKGRQGTALLNKPSDARFARAMIAALSEQGDAAIHQLTLDARPVSMQVVLHAGPAAFTWKTAYAEALHDFSPGMLLLEDYTMALLADRRVSYADSCAFDDSGYMATWKERAAIAGLWFSVRRGRSRMFSMVAQLQDNYLALRERAKALHHDRKQRNTHASK